MEIIKFWNQEILNWTKKSYDSPNKNFQPIIARKKIAESLLDRANKPLRILEVGCGCTQISPSKYKSYLGIDSAEKAISLNKRNYSENVNVKFIHKRIKDLSTEDLKDYNLILSLGVIDWIEDNEVKKLFELSKDKLFIHSFSNKNKSLQQLAYKVFKKLIQRKPIPNFHSKQFIQSNLKNSRLISSREMKFCTIVTNIN